MTTTDADTINVGDQVGYRTTTGEILGSARGKVPGVFRTRDGKTLADVECGSGWECRNASALIDSPGTWPAIGNGWLGLLYTNRCCLNRCKLERVMAVCQRLTFPV